MRVLRLGGLPARGSDPIEFLKLCEAISSTGYLMTLGSVVAFLLLLIDAIWRRFRPSHPTTVAP
jgi:hypothetical protein